MTQYKIQVGSWTKLPNGKVDVLAELGADTKSPLFAIVK